MRTFKSCLFRNEFVESTQVTGASLPARILTFLRTPLYRNGYALVLSSLSTSALGMVYWVLAARLYTPEVVGFNSAIISAMLFLSALSQLNLNNGLIRFIRNAGKTASRFTLIAYLISINVSVIAGFIFVSGISHWSPVLNALRINPYLAGWFIIATAAWCIFALQDGVLTGLRFATWVPVENTIYSLAKIVLLIIFSIYLPHLGVFAAWTLGIVALILPTNFLIFRSLIRKQASTIQGEKPSFVPGQVVKFVAADYLGGVSWMACTYLMPIIVTTRIGLSANAYFYLAWTIANTLYLITPNIGSSLIAETSTDPNKVGSHIYRVFLQVSSLVIPLALILSLAAPFILQIFGSRYSTEGTTLLRLLVISSIPNMIVALFISVARAQQRRVAMLVTNFFLSATILILSYTLMPIYGILGVGIAWLAGQTLTAAVILATQASSIWSQRGSSMEKATAYRLPRLPVQLRIASQTFSALKSIAPPRSLMNHFYGKKWQMDISRILPGIVRSIPSQPGYPDPSTWSNLRMIPTFTDMQVLFLGSPDMIPVAVMKLTHTDQGLRKLLREKEVLEELRNDARLRGWNSLIPKLLIKGSIDDQVYLVEQILPGITAQQFFKRRLNCSRIQAEAIARITDFHRRTAVFTQVGPGEMERWIDEPLFVVQNTLASLSIFNDHRAALERLAQRLYSAFDGCSLPLSWVHGDFSPGNILVTPDGSMVTGIVDWELSEDNNLPVLDLMMLLITTRMILQKQEMGEVVCALLAGESWSKNEQGFLDWSQQYLPYESLDMQSVLLLCWLRHVASNLSKSARFRTHRLWVLKNIETVLNRL